MRKKQEIGYGTTDEFLIGFGCRAKTVLQATGGAEQQKSNHGRETVTIYTGPVFEMCQQQFADIANYLDIPEDERNRILYPKRAVTVSCPIHRDDGSIAVFQGYRVQHHLSLGPTKGGTRFSLSVDIGEVAALAVWMSWKCALAGLPAGLCSSAMRA
jgi:hypothetical protein